MLFLSLASCAHYPLLSVVKEGLGVAIINCICTCHEAVNVGTVALLPCKNSTHGKMPDGCGFGDHVIFCDILTLLVCFSNRLCVSSLALGSFAEGVEAVYGMFDGDKNEELPRLLQCTMADVLLEEVQQSDTMFMSNTFLVSHR